jgi:Pyruvate/2-oxoacid:ferredoxin oxidoreductase delta subunit
MNLSHCTMREGQIPVILGGDLTNDIKSVTDAIASGKQAAMAMDIFFKNGWEHIEEYLNEYRIGTGPALSMAAYMDVNRPRKQSQIISFEDINTDYFNRARQVVPAMLAAAESARSFTEIESTLSRADAGKEAERCFNCGICTECDYCRVFCPEVAVTVEKARRFINLDYCKGCGICVTECPRNAMTLEEEKL